MTSQYVINNLISLPVGTKIEKHLVLNTRENREYVQWQFSHYSNSTVICNEDLIQGIEDYKKYLIKYAIEKP
jgi:hypothetical protein